VVQTVRKYGAHGVVIVARVEEFEAVNFVAMNIYDLEARLVPVLLTTRVAAEQSASLTGMNLRMAVLAVLAVLVVLEVLAVLVVLAVLGEKVGLGEKVDVRLEYSVAVWRVH